MKLPRLSARQQADIVPATKLVLYLLETSGQVMVDYFTFFYNLKHWGSAYRRGGQALVSELKRLRHERYARQMLYRLKKSRYLAVRKLGQRVVVELTEKGKVVALREQFRQAPRLSQRYTMVIFDIPESQRLVRNLFRRVLREGEFVMLQRSVWLSERDVHHSLVEFIRRLKLDRWVNVYYATNLYRSPVKRI